MLFKSNLIYITTFILMLKLCGCFVIRWNEYEDDLIWKVYSKGINLDNKMMFWVLNAYACLNDLYLSKQKSAQLHIYLI